MGYDERFTNAFNKAMDRFKSNVTYKVVTKTTDFEGNETSSFATGSTYSVIFFKENAKYIFDKQGLMNVGDAYILAPPSAGIKRYDQVTVDSRSYYIENVTRRYVVGTAIFDYAVLFLVA